MNKIKEKIKDNKFLCILLLASCILHIYATYSLGLDYNLNSDDIGYIKSGIYFKEHLTVSMYSGYPSAQIMPGMTYLIALFSFLFKSEHLMLSLKILYFIFSILSMIGIYKIVLLLIPNNKRKKLIAGLATLPLMSPPFLWMDNIILTETPFMCTFIYTLYFTLKEAKEHDIKNFFAITIIYICATLLKANFAIYPIFLIVYLLFKKYDLKLLLKECILAALIMSIFFIPWTIRNYKLFGEFIPLTYGAGNPKLCGTYQGYGYPTDEELDFDTYIKNYDDEDIQKYLNGTLDERLVKYNSLRVDGIHADYRIKKWWQKDKLSLIVSYIFIKPIRLFIPFYWTELFGIPASLVLLERKIELLIFIFIVIISLIKKKINIETVFLLSVLLSQVAIYSSTYAFDRYGQTLIFIVFIVIAEGIGKLTDKENAVKKM